MLNRPLFDRAWRMLLIAWLLLLNAGCGGSSSSSQAEAAPEAVQEAPEETSEEETQTEVSDASLSDLTLSGVVLDQSFQAGQTSYTASANFLIASLSVTATTSDNDATLTVNGVAVDSATPSPTISLAEGENLIHIEVTGDDTVTTETYTVSVTRATVSEFAQRAYLKASNLDSGDGFGFRVAISGNTLAIGTPLEDGTGMDETDNLVEGAGAVYVLTHNDGVWNQQAYLKASNAETRDSFGLSVAIDVDTLVVGAFGEDSGSVGDELDNSVGDSGAAYVFTRSDGVWSQQAYLKASHAGERDLFGASVAVHADTLVVGAPGESSANADATDNSATEAGAVYVFTRSDAAWSQQAYLKAGNADPGDFFGVSVAIDGDTLAVGAMQEDSASAADETDHSAEDAGAVYVFTRNNDAWSQQAYLKASNAGTEHEFGSSLAMDGDTLVVGAPKEGFGVSGDPTYRQGAAYVFVRNSDAWSEQAYLKAGNAAENDRFGFSVAISADTLAVGADREDSGTGADPSDDTVNDAGAVYVFTRSDGGWSQQTLVKADNAGEGDFFGTVALSGDTLAVGAYRESSNSADDPADDSADAAGAVYVFQ